MPSSMAPTPAGTISAPRRRPIRWWPPAIIWETAPTTSCSVTARPATPASMRSAMASIPAGMMSGRHPRRTTLWVGAVLGVWMPADRRWIDSLRLPRHGVYQCDQFGSRLLPLVGWPRDTPVDACAAIRDDIPAIRDGWTGWRDGFSRADGVRVVPVE